jgi:hypothetical protein
LKLPGKVEYVSAPKKPNEPAKFRVRAAVPSGDGRLKAKMFDRVRIPDRQPVREK